MSDLPKIESFYSGIRNSRQARAEAMLEMIRSRGSIYLTEEYLGRWRASGWTREDVEAALNDLATRDLVAWRHVAIDDVCIIIAYLIDTESAAASPVSSGSGEISGDDSSAWPSPRSSA